MTFVMLTIFLLLPSGAVQEVAIEDTYASIEQCMRAVEEAGPLILDELPDVLAVRGECQQVTWL